MSKLKTTEEFIKELNNKYPDIIVVGEYTGASKSIEVMCEYGHIRKVIPTNILTHGTGSNCRECSTLISRRITWDTTNRELLQKLVDENKTTKEIAHIFNTNKGAIDNACSRFNIKRDKFLNHTIKRIYKLLEELKYTLKTVDNNSYGNITYICNNGHEHTQNISNFLSGHYCPKCIAALGESTGEKELREFIMSQYSGWLELKDRNILDGLELDIVLPDLGLAFEYNGIYHHREDKIGKFYHKNKTDRTKEFGYNLIHVFEDEWLLRKDIVKSRIKSLLNTNDKIGARMCIVKEIDYPKEFLEDNHLFGAGSPTSYNYGLFLRDELIAVMTFNTPRFNTSYKYELVRYCSLIDINVVGGASKLFKYFVSKHHGSIISYSDRRWSSGNLYKQLGFSYLHTTDPGYKYYKKLTCLSRYQCQKHLLKHRFPNSYSNDLTEKEIMSLEGYYAVYDSGNDVWLWNPTI